MSFWPSPLKNSVVIPLSVDNFGRINLSGGKLLGGGTIVNNGTGAGAGGVIAGGGTVQLNITQNGGSWDPATTKPGVGGIGGVGGEAPGGPVDDDTITLLTGKSVQSDLGAQVARQSSLLATLSDLGEGLLITENGRFVAGNDAYVKLTGYTRSELESMPSLIDLAPEEEREQLAANLSRRLSGGDAPARYTSAVITKSGRRIQVDVAIHRVATRRNQLLALVS